MKKESLGLYLAKMILAVGLIVSFGALLGAAGYLTNNFKSAAPIIKKEINKIEIAGDRRSIINAETKEIIFTSEDAKKYLKDSGYEYDPDFFQTTNAKYSGDCFLDASLSNNKDRIIFSAGCLQGDLPQAWIGIYDSGRITKQSDCASYNNLIQTVSACIGEQNIEPSMYFLIGGSGRNFVWSTDDKSITYVADSGLSGMTEIRTIDPITGEILERKIETKLDMSEWLTYDSTADAESYHERYKIKYPKEFFYKIKRDDDARTLSAFFANKQGHAKFSIEVLPEKIGESVYDARNYSISNVRLGNNYFQELQDKKTGVLSYIYKTGYSDKNHSGDYYIIINILDLNSKEILIASLGTLDFLGNGKKEAIIGADEGSWKQVFKSDKYGFQLKAQNGFTIIDKLDDNLSLVFVSDHSNIFLNLSLLSGVSTAEEWLDREMIINKNSTKRADREYYRIGDSDAIGIMVKQADNSGELKNYVFYAARGQYLYSISAPIAGINEFAYARMVANFRFLEPQIKLIGLKSKWPFNNVFEFNIGSGKLERVLNKIEFAEKGYEWKDVKWYETKIAGIIPEEIKNFFSTVKIDPQGSMDIGDWLSYRDKNKALELVYPKEWELEDYSAADILFFNVKKEKEDPSLPKVTIMIDRSPSPMETLAIIGDVSILKFNNIEALATTMYGDKGESDPYAYMRSGNTFFIEFHSGAHDYFIEYHFNGGNYNLQEFNTFLSSMRINQNQ